MAAILRMLIYTCFCSIWHRQKDLLAVRASHALPACLHWRGRSLFEHTSQRDSRILHAAKACLFSRFCSPLEWALEEAFNCVLQ